MATQLLRQVLQSTALLLHRASRKSCSAGVPCLHLQLEGNRVQWGSEPTQIPASPTTHSIVSTARVTPQTGGVSLIHLLCTSANISVIFGSDTLTGV